MPPRSALNFLGLVFLLKYKMAIGVGRREWRRRGSPFLLRRKQRHGPSRGNPQLLANLSAAPETWRREWTPSASATNPCTCATWERDARLPSFLRCQHLISPARHVPPSACNPGGRRRAYPLRLF